MDEDAGQQLVDNDWILPGLDRLGPKQFDGASGCLAGQFVLVENVFVALGAGEDLVGLLDVVPVAGGGERPITTEGLSCSM